MSKLGTMAIKSARKKSHQRMDIFPSLDRYLEKKASKADMERAKKRQMSKRNWELLGGAISTVAGGGALYAATRKKKPSRATTTQAR